MQEAKTSDNDAMRQTTLAGWVSVGGIGLHTGQRVELSAGPAPAGSGIVFERADLAGSPRIPARPGSVVDATFCTVLGVNGTRLSTVEHLLAAFYGMGVDNALVIVDGEEVPILDGSAAGWVELITRAGIRQLAAPRPLVRLLRPVEIKQGERLLRARPARRLSIDCMVDFNHPLVSDQSITFKPGSQDFNSEIAPARTFGFLKDVGELQRNGFARGGSLQNAVVVDAYSVVNPEGLRYPDEFVRHKVLDILGDLSLLGGVLCARLVARKSGHGLHHQLVQRLAGDPELVEVVHTQKLPADGDVDNVPGLELAKALGA